MDIDEHNDGAASTAPADDIRSQLTAAMADHTETTASSSSEAKPSTAAERARDQAGRFAPKAGDPPAADAAAPNGATKLDPAQPANDGTAPATTPKAPVGWDPQTFVALPPAIQDKILKRESDYAKGIQTHAEKARSFDEFNTTLAPHRELFAKHGQTVVGGVQALLNAQAALDRDPVGTLAQIAKGYGIDLSGILPQAAQHRAQAPQIQADPRVDQIASWVQSQQQREHSERVERTNREIATFAADPANKHFEAVQSHIIGLLTSGQAKNLREAYDAAVYINPVTRAALIAEQTAPHVDAAKGQAAVARAKAAAKSVTGAPGGVSTTPKAGSKGSIADDIRAAFAQAS